MFGSIGKNGLMISMVAKIALLRGFKVKRSACSQFPACREFLSRVIKRKLLLKLSFPSIKAKAE